MLVFTFFFQLSVCLLLFFVWGYRPTREFTTHGEVTIAGEAHQIYTYARHT